MTRFRYNALKGKQNDEEKYIEINTLKKRNINQITFDIFISLFKDK